MLHVVNSSWPQHDELILARTEQVSARAPGLPLHLRLYPVLACLPLQTTTLPPCLALPHITTQLFLLYR
jgi:hypothetical protein